VKEGAKNGSATNGTMMMLVRLRSMLSLRRVRFEIFSEEYIELSLSMISNFEL